MRNATVIFEKPNVKRVPAPGARKIHVTGLGLIGIVMGACVLGFFCGPLLAAYLGWFELAQGVDMTATYPIFIVCLLAGLGLIILSMAQIYRAYVTYNRSVDEGVQPWTLDHDWDREQRYNTFWRLIIISSTVMTVFGLINVLILIVGYMLKDVAKGDISALWIALGIFIGIWALALLLILITLPTEYQLKDLTIDYSDAPYFLGEPITLSFQLPQRMRASSRNAVFKLCLIQEGVEQQHLDRDHKTGARINQLVIRPMQYKLWSQRAEIKCLANAVDEQGRVSITFDPPADLMGNQLLAMQASCWQINLATQVTWYPSNYTYFVPIYRRDWNKRPAVSNND